MRQVFDILLKNITNLWSNVLAEFLYIDLCHLIIFGVRKSAQSFPHFDYVMLSLDLSLRFDDPCKPKYYVLTFRYFCELVHVTNFVRNAVTQPPINMSGKFLGAHLCKVTLRAAQALHLDQQVTLAPLTPGKFIRILTHTSHRQIWL